MPPKRKRSAADAAIGEDGNRATAGPSTKRSRRTAATTSTTANASRKPSTASADAATIDEIDLVDEDNTLSRALQKQRAEQVKAQQGGADEDKPTKLSKLTCVICLEPPTDLTATLCGHLFCHHCLMEALIAGENRALAAGESRKSQCPVCRKNLSRAKKNDIIPLLMKKGTSAQPTGRKSRA